MNGPLGSGRGAASILLSHAHWDHIQGFPFFVPLYVPGNVFNIYGGGKSSAMLEGILEGQMAPQYFPVQTLKNMGATIEISAVSEGAPFDVEGCRVIACANPHGRSGALAFRIEEAGRAVVYASDAGYPAGGPSEAALALYRNADVLIHDSTFTPEDRRRYVDRGLSSIEDAVAVATRAAVKTLVLFHYDQDYSDTDVDALLARGRRLLDEQGASGIALVAASEGATLTV
jgi:phosphoribosyl 1,2-cyclic phosphodiesterase